MLAVEPNVTVHQPVMLREAIDLLAPGRGGVFVDGTYGAGGHSRALIEQGAHRVLGIDRDPDAAASAPPVGVTVRQGVFSELCDVLQDAGISAVCGVLLDLGISSDQLDDAARGFSFMRPGPLDMRMSGTGESAASLLDRIDERALEKILKDFGEEPRASRIARAILGAHRRSPLRSTIELARVVAEASPPGSRRTHPATRTFQALRIAVNDELEELRLGLLAAERALSPGGVLCVISFHSLEDRIVKRFLAARAGGGGGWRYLPESKSPPATFEILTRRPLRPSREEVESNPRARSARLRAACRTVAPINQGDPQ